MELDILYVCIYVYTGCGRKKSPIWEANKFKTKEDTTNDFFLFSGKYTEYRFTSTYFEQNTTQVAALNIDTLM
jgi:hypothetical protein